MSRIVFDCERMKYPNTGLFAYCYQLGQRLLHLAGEDTIVPFLPSYLQGIFGNDTEYLHHSPLYKFKMPVLNYDVWHSTYQSSQYLPQLNRRIKVLLTIHDLNFLYDKRKSAKKKAVYLSRVQKNINRSDMIVCISDYAMKDVLEHCKVGSRPVKMIHNGTNQLEEPSLTATSYRPLKKFLFSIGVINRKKNFHVLLPLLKDDHDMELLIAGPADDPDYLHYMHDKARTLGVENSVRMLGPITEGEKAWYLRNCYAFTFPSLSEGFGLPVTEAMSVGKPLFLSSRTALPEIGRDVAFYFNEFDEEQMQKTFHKGMQDYHRENMCEKIIKRSEDFCWLKSARQYLELYRDL